MRVLIVKLTSMGDLIHALPALTDAAQAIPGIEFDWVVDEAFAEIPRLHPAVSQIITSAHRRWFKHKWSSLTSGELKQFWHDVRANTYDIVLDAQNNIKSAFVTRLCRGLRCGPDKNGVREFGAQFAYRKHYSLPDFKQMHAITRQRLLFAKALGYHMPETTPDFAINVNALPVLPFELPKPYVLFIHNTTWSSKHWPETYWAELIKMAVNAGYHVALPWGNAQERERAQRLAKTDAETTVLPELDIRGKGRVIYEACGIVTVDTGLAHLTAALNKPAVHLYGPTDMNLLSIQNSAQKFLAVDYPCAPCYLHDCKFGNNAQCFEKTLPASLVWQHFSAQMAAADQS